jgi:hypothetical protein
METRSFTPNINSSKPNEPANYFIILDIHLQQHEGNHSGECYQE